MLQSGIFFDSSCNESRSFVIDSQYNYPCLHPQKVCVVYALSGIYKSVIDGEPCIYIGSSFVHQTRNSDHFRELTNCKHDNPRLQNYFNKFGVDSLSLFVLEHSIREEVRDREQNWIDAYKANFGDKVVFNIASKVDKPSQGRKASEATRALMSDKRKGEGNSFYGKHHSHSAKKANADKHSKTYIFLHPDGTPISVFNLNQYCKDNGLSQASMWKVDRGLVRHHKGYRKPTT